MLEAAGRQVVVPTRDICCGRPLYDYGFLDAAERWMSNIFDTLDGEIQAGLPFVFLEPSCCSVFRDESVKLMPGEENGHRLSHQTLHAERISGEGVPGLRRQYPLRREALVHGHCHHKTVLDFGRKRRRSRRWA